MRQFSKIFPFLFLLLAFCTPQPTKHELTVMTFNIRFDNPADGVNAWPNRIPVVETYMQEELPDIVGMQENLHHQNIDLLRIMPGYAYVGTGRDDGGERGEFSPIFYRIDKFDVLDNSQFWLSETPDVPGSIGWEAILPRIVTWVKLKHKASGLEMFVFNTHYSHVSDLARRKSMEFMSEMINQIAVDSPTIVLGDFNIREDSDLYRYMAEHVKQNNGLRDARYISQQPSRDISTTFNAFREDAYRAVIDYIFVDDHFEVLSYDVDEVKEGEIFISDHWPVKATLRLK